MSKILTATWNPGKDPAVDRPASIRWENGTPATLKDYARHRVDTSACDCGRDGSLTVVMYPDLTAAVWFDQGLGRWVCEAPNRRVILELDDPDVADDQIVAELATYDVFYRAVIERV